MNLGLWNLRIQHRNPPLCTVSSLHHAHDDDGVTALEHADKREYALLREEAFPG